jgi:hypothetical protein
VAFGFVVLAQVGVGTPLLEIALWLAVSGIGQGLFLSPNTTAIMSAVPASESSIASGLFATTRAVAQALSVAIAGAVYIGLGGAAAGAALAAGVPTGPTQVALDGTFLAALRGALLVSGLFAAIGAVLSLSRAQDRRVEVSRPQVVTS